MPAACMGCVPELISRFETDGQCGLKFILREWIKIPQRRALLSRNGGVSGMRPKGCVEPSQVEASYRAISDFGYQIKSRYK